MKVTRLALLATTAVLAGCQGIDARENLPLAEAEMRAPSELVAAVHAGEPTGEDIIMDGLLWVPWGKAIERIGPLHSVGSAHGSTVYARSWDVAPFHELFIRQSEGWQGLAPVLTGTGGGSAAH